jgi:protein-tyrosine phosphatase
VAGPPHDRKEQDTLVVAGQDLGIASAPNLRDVGGYATRDGATVRTGLLYRSTALNRLTDEDAAAIDRLGIRTIYDLRTAFERTAEPDRLPPGVEYVVADVVDSHAIGSPTHLFGLLDSPDAAREALGDGKGTQIWMEHYRLLVRLDSARASYGRIFRDLATDAHRPALVHCSTGKDRTGWAAAILLTLLDVPYETVMADFLQSASYIERLVQPFLDRFAAQGGDPDLLRPIFSVVPAYLDAGLDALTAAYGGIEAYFAEGLGVDAATQRALREAFLAPTPISS